MGVPAHLFEVSALMDIDKLLGESLLVDHATINQTRLSFARIFVEIDISNPPTEEIILSILGKESRHKVAWDRIPLFCVNCKHVGHVIDKCHALGRKGRLGSKDYQTPTKVQHPNHDPEIIRPERLPKEAKKVGTSPSIDHTNKEKDSGNQKKDNEGVMDAQPLVPRAPFERQPSVDEDGFQLVSRKRKGKAHRGDMHSKAPNLDNLCLCF
ncbi:uncharacterized protein LOC121786729 [Salvia splendens]|uniref:uncharacterized protein LOC121786729 n=1 Tax=Salvia splendens TaxID=180675 RepID=UPI001C26B05B|nr:uncharacterized protein LOC121786729 [Salvia splendens]